MTNNNLDDLLFNSLKDAEIEINTPIDVVEQMISKKISARLDRQRKKQRLILQATASVILLIFISGAILFPQPVYALKKQLLQTIVDWGKSINITLRNDTNEPQPQDKLKSEINAMQAKVPFKILTPKYLPPEFVFKSIEQGTNDDKAEVNITFASPKSFIILTESVAADNFNYSINIEAAKNKVQKISINKYEGNLITFADGSCSLSWITEDSVICQLLGGLSPEQAQEVAVSVGCYIN